MLKKSIEDRIQLLTDVHQIQNLMSRYEYFNGSGLREKCHELYAKKAPDVRVGIDNFIVNEGIEGVRRFYISASNRNENYEGHMHFNTLTTPVIEVAGDGKTARGVWISSGYHGDSGIGQGAGPAETSWEWNKYKVDFIKEDGDWKFWHYQMYRIFVAPYDMPWTEVPPTPSLPGFVKPVRSTTTHNWVYHPTVATENVPAPPEPYETFDEKTAIY